MYRMLALVLVLGGCSSEPSTQDETEDQDHIPADAAIKDAGPNVDSDAGSGCQPGQVQNWLDGSCFWILCVSGQPVFGPKPDGWPCVYRTPGGQDWTASQCIDAVCGPVTFY
jgi:hypothetical protein